MKSLTTIIASKSFAADTMVLNDKEESIDKNPRMKDVIQNLKKRAQPLIVDGVTKITSEDWANYKLKIISVNNFPTAAGLASSASGYACFTKCLATLYNVKENFEGELSTIARQGSGSACRSMYGGWVAWRMGVKEDGTDSIAQQVQPHTHWPDMRVLILVANSGQKETSSTDGMQRSVRTSPLLKVRDRTEEREQKGRGRIRLSQQRRKKMCSSFFASFLCLGYSSFLILFLFFFYLFFSLSPLFSIAPRFSFPSA